MSEFDPSKIDIEGRRNLFTKKPIIVASCLEARPSGILDEDIIGWERFLAAWFLDRAEGSLNTRLTEALKVFILTWVLPGRGGYKLNIALRNPKNPEDVEEIEAVTEKQPDFTYNPEKKTSIEDLQLTYRTWMEAVADLKINLAGSSHGATATNHEHIHWGGPVDISRDVQAADLNPNDPVKKVFDL